MTAVLDRPASGGARQAPTPGSPSPRRRPRRREPRAALPLTLALLVAASLPLTRVLVGTAFLRQVFAAIVAALVIGWATRRVGLRPLTGLLVGALAYVVYAGAAFLPDTLWAGVVPTTGTLSQLEQLFDTAFSLARVRPAPAFPEPPLVFLAASGAWAVAMAADLFVFRQASPGRAILAALVMWSVPLSLAAPTGRAWAWAVALLVPAVLLLLTFADQDLVAWGRWPSGARAASATTGLSSPGWMLAAVAITAGALGAWALPGYGEPAWHELRGQGGTTLTTNPIVALRPSLVAQNAGPILQVHSERPVYLRTTALDVYSSNEEWTNDGIRGRPIGPSGDVPRDHPARRVEELQVQVEVVGLDRAVLVPAPYQARWVDGPAADAFQYDPTTATFTLDRGVTLGEGDRYTVAAGVPTPTPEQLDDSDARDPGSHLTALPDDVPPEVAQLAARIVDRAGATTSFRQALAIQNELRSWEYSLSPPQGHSSEAMLSFLENRVGYCEQFAGTMAVMLRTLDIPARVAVGFTPGELVDPEASVWSVTNANAHAWVEVLFPGFGWVTFEPTPRTDGNVLVPSAANLAPSQTVSDPEMVDLANPVPFDQIVPPMLPGEEQRLANRLDAGVAANDGRGGRSGTAGALTWAVGAALVAATAVGLRKRRSREPVGSPPERALAARERLTRVGRGLGVPALPTETDREYLMRLSAGVGGGRKPAETLAARAAQARYSVGLDEDAARDAERAAHRLTALLLDDLPAWRRTLVGVRGTALTALAPANARIGRLSAVVLRRRSPAAASASPAGRG